MRPGDHVVLRGGLLEGKVGTVVEVSGDYCSVWVEEHVYYFLNNHMEIDGEDVYLEVA